MASSRLLRSVGLGLADNAFAATLIKFVSLEFVLCHWHLDAHCPGHPHCDLSLLRAPRRHLHEGEGSADKDLRPAFPGTAIGKVTRFFGATSSTHWERARRSAFKRSVTLCGDHGNHGGFSDEGTLALQMVLLNRMAAFAMRFMHRALASMLGQDVRSWRKRFIKPIGQSLELHWMASSRPSQRRAKSPRAKSAGKPK